MRTAGLREVLINYYVIGSGWLSFEHHFVWRGLRDIATQLAPTSFIHHAGRVTFYDAATGAVLNSVLVGSLPDMVVFTPDSSRLLSANEGEPSSYNQPNSVDPEGSVSIINLANGVANATVQTAGFQAFNGQEATLRAQVSASTALTQLPPRTSSRSTSPFRPMEQKPG